MKQKKVDSAYWWRHLSYGLAAAILLYAMACGAARWYRQMHANQLVRECRNVWLACRLVSIEHYADAEKIFDKDTQSGLRPIIETEVRRKAKSNAPFEILAWNEEQSAPARMEYISEPYVVEFFYKDGVRSWQVYRKDTLLELNANVG